MSHRYHVEVFSYGKIEHFMKKRIELTYVRDRLQARMNYRNPDIAFNVLLYGWCKKRHHNKNWLSNMKRRGWMTLDMARDFAHYCGYMFI